MTKWTISMLLVAITGALLVSGVVSLFPDDTRVTLEGTGSLAERPAKDPALALRAPGEPIAFARTTHRGHSPEGARLTMIVESAHRASESVESWAYAHQTEVLARAGAELDTEATVELFPRDPLEFDQCYRAHWTSTDGQALELLVARTTTEAPDDFARRCRLVTDTFVRYFPCAVPE